jgi:rifampicin phosphotransferase
MSSCVLGFQDIDKTKITVVGGKGANLGEISKVEGIRVPDGFCISPKRLRESLAKRRRLTNYLHWSLSRAYRNLGPALDW